MSVSAARRILVVLAAMLQGPGAFAQSPLEEDLRSVLGHFPAPPPLRMKIVETVQVEGGTRQKIEYSVEDPDTLFDRPADKVQAYLFVPDRSEGDKFPAVIAIHQDEPSTHLGKAEPAGLAGADDQHYGLELFNRGYVVICPDRYYHAERRRIPSAAEAPSH